MNVPLHSTYTFLLSPIFTHYNVQTRGDFMSDCMSSSPFDSETLLNWFAGEAQIAESGNIGIDNIASLSPEFLVDSSQSALHSDHDAGTHATSMIPVVMGDQTIQLPIPIDLLCALLLTRGKQSQEVYSLEDVMHATENLKRFREVSASSPSTAASSLLPTPAPVPVIPDSSASVDIVSMCLDPSGSAVVQEMLWKASELEKELIVSQLCNAAVLVSVNTHGCRVIQKALESGSHDLNLRLFKSIPAFKIVDLCMDVNGNHVMQKFVESLPQSALHEIVLAMSDPTTIPRLSLHSYGCRVIQRLLVRCAPEDRSTILGFVISSFPELVSDQFGNYVAQHSLEYSNENEKKAIISTLTLMDVVGLCCNKFASNVVEKAIRARLTEKTVLHRLIATIVQTEETLLSLMKDKYGNYVVKAICDLGIAEFPEVIYVKNVLIANSVVLKKYTYGFHLVEKLERGGRNRAGSGWSESSNERKIRRGNM
jgi:hypothetical protein